MRERKNEEKRAEGQKLSVPHASFMVTIRAVSGGTLLFAALTTVGI
jgi:hypothetical protein